MKKWQQHEQINKQPDSMLPMEVINFQVLIDLLLPKDPCSQKITVCLTSVTLFTFTVYREGSSNLTSARNGAAT